ncbi:hypothetical protein TNCV_3792791 [Trichonephila clavipes]|nr:hypothetical protein TNCV_3792791 [Trichonephila clavipes]
MINSRPITFVGSETEEPIPLTPAHFIIGKRITSLPPYSETSNKLYVMKDASCPVNFSTNRAMHHGCTVRVMAVYSAPEHSAQPVTRCLNHSRVSAADKGCRVYPLDPRPDAVALCSGCTSGKRRAWFSQMTSTLPPFWDSVVCGGMPE